MFEYRKKAEWVFLFQIIVIIFSKCHCDDEKSTDEDINISGFVRSLEKNRKIDQSMDEEYEDLRDELLAHHAALIKLRSSRRSMFHTPCWQLGGICVKEYLCAEPLNYKSHVPGCMDKRNVCCFVWNRLKMRDLKHKGISNPVFPWSIQQDFGGKGLIIIDTPKAKGKKKKKLKKLKPEPVKIDVEKEIIAFSDTDVEKEKDY